jgi:hypothetical protein
LKLGGAELPMVRFSGHLLAAALLIGAGSSSLASAQPIQVSAQKSQIGFTGGMSIDPEQGFVGVFWRSPEIGRRFHIRPGLEGGFGDGLKLATFNIDFLMRFPIGSSGWDFIQGGGPTIVVAVFDIFDDSDSELSAGGSYIFGFGHSSGFLGEFRIGGGGNVPSLKLTAGYAFAF